jgi:hypothetical protein
MHLDREPVTYRFDTAAELDAFMKAVNLAIECRRHSSAALDAFLKGVEEAEGYPDFSVYPTDGACPACGVALAEALFAASETRGNA